MLDLKEPIVEVLEGFLSSDIVGQEHALGTSVEYPAHRPKWFLTSCIPYLQFYIFLLDVQPVITKVDPNRNLMFFPKFIVHDTLHQRRFSDHGVADYNELEQVVLGCHGFAVHHFVRLLDQLFDLILLHLDFLLI